MSKTQLKVLWVGIGIFVLIGLFPPTGSAQWPYDFLLLGADVNVSHLCIHWAIVAVVTFGLIYTRKVDPELKIKANAVCYYVALGGLVLLALIVIIPGGDRIACKL